MTLSQHRPRRAHFQGVWFSLGIIGPLGMLLVSTLMLYHMRQDAWAKADQTAANLLHIVEQDIDRNISLYDLSLQGVVDSINAPELANLSPSMRQLVLFDRAASASDKGVMLVLNENGDIVEDMGTIPHRISNYADREYFQVHKARADVGLLISKPLTSRLTGLPMIALSRRINKPDGSFGGVVLGTLKLSYFTRLFSQAGLGPQDALNLFRTDGTRIARYPYVESDIGANISGSAIFERFVRDGQGSFTATSVRDQVKRRYTFSRVADLPLILDVTMSVRGVERSWWFEALTIGLVSLILCGSTIGLVLWAAREFGRRIAIEAELARLSTTDGLTGIPNRRRFDEMLPSACVRAKRDRTPLSLLIVDADHFKRINDQFGHQIGDEVLKTLAHCLTAVVHRNADLVCRLGGEEFVLLLPDTDLRGARQVAEKVHRQLASQRGWPAGIAANTVTVSIGVASLDEEAGTEPEALYAAADKALYEAKAGGRNQTCCAPLPTAKSRQAGLLRIISR